MRNQHGVADRTQGGPPYHPGRRLLLRTQHQEDTEGASNEKREPDLWGVGTLEVFF